MPSYNAQGGFLGFKTQSVQGTYKDPGAANPNNGLFMKLLSGAMGSDRTLVKPSAEIGGTRNMVGAELGPVAYSATYKFYARFNSLATLLYAVMGTVVDQGFLRTDPTCGTTTGSPTVTDAAIKATDLGLPVSGTGIPANSFVGTVTAGVSFVLSSSATTTTPVNATATGSVTLTLGTGAVGVHTVNTALALPWLSLEEQIGNGYEVINYTDTKVNSLSLSVAANGYLEGEAQVNGITGIYGSTPTGAGNQVWDTSPQTVGTNVIVKLGGVQVPAKDVKLDFKNNLDVSDYQLGSFGLHSIVEKMTDVSATITVRPSDNHYLRQAVNGAVAAVTPQGQKTLGDLSITFQTWEGIGNSATPYQVSLDLPNSVVEPFKVSPQGDNPIENTLTVGAYQPSNAVDICTAVVTNGLSATV